MFPESTNSLVFMLPGDPGVAHVWQENVRIAVRHGEKVGELIVKSLSVEQDIRDTIFNQEHVGTLSQNLRIST